MTDDPSLFINGRRVVELCDKSRPDTFNAHELEGFNRDLLEETNEDKRKQQTERLLRARRVPPEVKRPPVPAVAVEEPQAVVEKQARRARRLRGDR